MSIMYLADNVSAGGTVYPTTGEHIRAVNSLLNKDLNAIIDYMRVGQLSLNVFDVNTLEFSKGFNEITNYSDVNEFGYYSANNTHLNTVLGYNLYNFISVKSGDYIYRFYDNTLVPIENLSMSLYDINKKFLGCYYRPTVPNDPRIKYIRIPANDKEISKQFLISINIKPTQYVPYLKNEDATNFLENQWYGKTWYAYGTSLTNIDSEGKYPKYVKNFSGMKLVNKAISGGGIVASGGNIRKAIMNTTDGKLNADIITLETGANDISVVLGSIYDTSDATYCGALNQCIRYLQANTNAQIVVISSPNARYESDDETNKYTPEKTFGSDNHSKYDQWKAIENVCKLNSVPYIPMGEHSGLGYARMDGNSLYNVDNIHHTELGGYNLAKFVWSKLKDIPCWYSELPSK